MKKLLSLSLLILLGSAALVIPVFAGGKGWIRIEPHAFDPPDPIILGSPATFYVTLTSADKEADDPQLLLITSKACLDGLNGGLITVSWSWEPYVPPMEVSPFFEVDPKAGGADTKLASEIRLWEARFGLSPIDRRRLEWEVEQEAESPSEPAGDVTSGDETSGDETSGDETSGNETSGNETSGDETSGDETSGDETSPTSDSAESETQD